MIWQAWYNGPEQRSDWNLDISGGKSLKYATIHRAAFKQCIGDNLGIHRPSQSSRIKICYIDSPGAGICWGDWGGGILPDIKVWGKLTTTGADKTTDNVFSMTSHELGHMSHWNYVGKYHYARTTEKIYEAWASAVQWSMTNDEYHKLGARYGVASAINYDCQFTNQLLWPVSGDIIYSPIFIDLIDSQNQRVILGGNTAYPNDLVSGFTLLYLQNNILYESLGYSSLLTSVRNHKINGVTDEQINQLFTLYFQ
jgi:hypothetical protein